MKLKILASGSSGNSTFLEINNKKFLIDVGISSSAIEKSLRSFDVDPKTIDYILLTHTHVDHVRGLEVFCKKNKPQVYITEKIHKDIPFLKNNFFYIKENIIIENIEVSLIKTSHDSSESYGYIFENTEESLVYITDTGYINKKTRAKIKDKKIYVIESNHDVEMLMNTRRPHAIKMRILGDKGHLSNEDSADCICEIIGPKTKKIILTHLSEEANTPEKAYEIMKKRIQEKATIIVAQKEGTELFEL